jgi:hypothetical protein
MITSKIAESKRAEYKSASMLLDLKAIVAIAIINVSGIDWESANLKISNLSKFL